MLAITKVEKTQTQTFGVPPIHSCSLQANAAQADVQEWHEGLREYPDLSLAPHLRRQQFRARNREIRGRVQARCGGLQILHLAENKVRAPMWRNPDLCLVVP